jgi:hypothetical protein
MTKQSYKSDAKRLYGGFWKWMIWQRTDIVMQNNLPNDIWFLHRRINRRVTLKCGPRVPNFPMVQS